MSFVLPISFSILDGEGVAKDIEDLQIFEPSFLLGLSAEICDNLLKGSYEVIANREDVQLGATMESIDGGYFVIIKCEVSEVD